MKNTERNPTSTYTIGGTLTLLYRKEALARTENIMHKKSQPQMKFLRTVKGHAKMV